MIALSVIIPVGENDDSWTSLIPDLRYLLSEDEIIFVTNNKNLSTVKGDPLLKDHQVSIVSSCEGRAKQLNVGVSAARFNFLWFVHCDSRFTATAVEALRESLSEDPEALHFFDLKFLDGGGPRRMKLTELGVWIRSRVFRVPFGDQGFCISKKNFARLGGFDEQTSYGEDHLFVWAAHQNALKVKAIGHCLYTSARKYITKGWLRTTSTHLKLTVKQAIPQLWRFIRKRGFL